MIFKTGVRAELWFQQDLVAIIVDLFESDGTTYGRYELALGEQHHGNEPMPVEFVKFSVDWNERLKQATDTPPSADEFSAFAGVIESGWFLRLGQKTVEIADAPVFFAGNEVSMRLL